MSFLLQKGEKVALVVQEVEKYFRQWYHQLVKRIQFRTNNNQADAEDVVMEAFTRALQYQHSFKEDKVFEYWFVRILFNSLKTWRKEQFNQFEYTDAFDEEEIPPDLDIEEKIDEAANVLIAIASVENVEHKEILSLHFEQGFNLREISQITNTPYQTVASIVGRFKRRLE